MRSARLVCFAFGVMIAIGSASAQATGGLAREVLQPKDGWAAAAGGTTGGSAAAEAQVFTVGSRSELIRALGGDNETNRSNGTPKIIMVKGTIEVNVDDADKPVGPEGYADPAFAFKAYMAEYAPEKWGKEKVPGGPIEEARVRSKKAQEKRIVVNVGSNTTIVGVGSDARIAGGSLKMEKVDNVIVRNIAFEAPLDFFPQWDPTDGSSGNWNSEYDNITIREATHIWIDHCTFSDGAHTDKASGSYFGRKFQQHDGLLDVTNASDYVTISWCVFRDHDKVALIGSSDSRKTDEGHLRVTLHHNYFKDVTQRMPRARFGQIHAYNNYHEATPGAEYPFSYAWGIGVSSRLVAQNNVFDGVDPERIIDVYKGTTVAESGTLVDGRPVTDLLEAANKAKKAKLTPDVGWTPELVGNLDPSAQVAAVVKAGAGAGRLR